MPVGRLDVNLTDETALTALLARDDIYPEVKDNIRRVAQNAIATGNIDANVTIFSPTFIESSYNNARGSSMTINGKYQNTPMQSIRTHYTNISTETFNLSNGKAVVNYAKGFVNLLISGAGLKNSTISLFGMGVSAYQSALDYYNATNISGSDHDFCEAHVRYDCTMQWTYALLGEQKYLGLVSQKSTLNYVYYRQYFYNAARFNGDEEIIEEYPNKPYSTEHFDDPWEIAYRYYGGPRDESGITVDIGGKKIHLDPP